MTRYRMFVVVMSKICVTSVVIIIIVVKLSDVVQAVDQLNIKPNFWKDLVTDEPFTRKDIITIQDPTHLDKFNLASFYHIQKNLKLVSEGVLVFVTKIYHK